MRSLALVFGALLPQHVLATLKIKEEATPQEITCTDLELIVPGHDLKDALQTVCKEWPTGTFGPFPIKTIDEIKEMVKDIFDVNGIWEAFQQDKKSAGRWEMFCWRGERLRTIPDFYPPGLSALDSEPQPRPTTCPETVNSDMLEEFAAYLDDRDETKIATEGGYWSCNPNEAGNCSCTRRDTFDNAVQATISPRPAQDDCKMVHKGTCYGDCPTGFQPTFLLGVFRPVCTSICGDTGHVYGCGFGCANSRWNCFLVILDQIKEIIQKLMDFIVFAIEGVDMVKMHLSHISEFATTTMKSVSGIATNLWTKQKQYSRSKSIFGIVLAMTQDIKEATNQGAEELAKTQTFITELTDSVFGWERLNSGWIAEVFKRAATPQNGENAFEAVVSGLYSQLESFQYKTCEVASREVLYAVEECGVDELLGPWIQQGEYRQKPRYRLIGNDWTRVEWHDTLGAWRMYFMDRSEGTGKYWWWIGVGWKELYRSYVNSQHFPSYAWQRVEGPWPLPIVVSA